MIANKRGRRKLENERKKLRRNEREIKLREFYGK